MKLRSWLEISITNLRRNFELFIQDKPKNVNFLCVVKCNSYGHGADIVAREALNYGACYLGVACLYEALQLRDSGIVDIPILIFGETSDEDISLCLENNLTFQVQSIEKVRLISQYASKKKCIAKVHFKVDTGLGRYGVHWSNAIPLWREINKFPNVKIEGIMTHLAKSDDADKTYAYLQWERFLQILKQLEKENALPQLVHVCNTCGYLDLPEMHANMVRIGILPLGVYPSTTCRHIGHNKEDIKPVLSVKSRLAYIKDVNPGDFLGYGMHFRANKKMRIAVVPIGYGDGYPRLRNCGYFLVSGEKANILGGNAMDATLVDITDIKNLQLNDIVTVIGEDQGNSITVRQVADWSHSATYQILSQWSERMERYYL